jgi:ribosome-associated protein
MTENNLSTNPPPPPTARTQRSKALRGLSVRTSQDDSPTRAIARRDPQRVQSALEHAQIAAQIAENNRAGDIVLLDLREATPLLDFFVIATAHSRRQSHAIASEIDAEMKRLGEQKLGFEGSEEGRWILIDYGDFVVHIFSTEGRAYYGLDDIWGDAPRLEWTQGQSPPRRPASPPSNASPPAESPESGNA